MQENPHNHERLEKPLTIAESIGELVRRSLLEVADMKDLEERAGEISKRASKIVPPPDTEEF